MFRFEYLDDEGLLHYINLNKVNRVIFNDEELIISFEFGQDYYFHCTYIERKDHESTDEFYKYDTAKEFLEFTLANMSRLK